MTRHPLALGLLVVALAAAATDARSPPFRPGRGRGGPCGVVACPANYAPVCGSDGTTYPNSCSLNAAKCENPRLRIVSNGECNANPSPPSSQCPTFCTFEYNPVCGSDGTTYANPCGLEAAQCDVPSLTLSHRGEC